VTDASLGRPSGRWRRPGPWLLAALVLGAAALPGGLAQAHLVRVAPEVGVAHPYAPTPSFSVDLTDTPSFDPRALNATVSGTSSVTLTIGLDNTGAYNHTFTMVNANQSGVVLNRSWTPQKLDGYFATNGTLANESLAPGNTDTVSVTLAASESPRSFEFVSLVPYQFQAGMFGFLNVTPLGPTVVVEENTTDQFRFVPSILSTGTNTTGPVDVHVHLTNQGSLSHTFTVSSQVNVTLSSLGNLSTFPPLVNQSIPSGPSVWANFTVPKAGVYEYVCTVPGHFAAGMFGFLYVGVPVPPPPPSPSTAIVEVPILVGSMVLLGVGLLLLVVSAYTGRFPRKPSSGSHHP
jgi:uncharacterized cupredoxin-like copper-binding protein